MGSELQASGDAGDTALRELIAEIAPGPIEPWIEELAAARELPRFAVGVCALRFDEAAPPLRAVLARAADGERLDADELRLLFRGVHILGGRRDAQSFRPLLRLLRRGGDEVDDLLDDARAESLPRIAAGMFDGDADALFDAIADTGIDGFDRWSLLTAATFLTWEGRIPKERTVAALERLDDDRLAPAGDPAWLGWQEAIALLGLRDLVPRVERAWADGGFDAAERGKEHFWKDLEAAEAAPGDFARFEAAGLPFGYIQDVIVELERYSREFPDDVDFDLFDDDALLDELFMPEQPALNPWRHVGRNDPLPVRQR